MLILFLKRFFVLLFFCSFFLFLCFSFFSKSVFAGQDTEYTETTLEKLPVCKLDDEECLSQIECDDDLTEDECEIYRTSQVKAARDRILLADAGLDKEVLINKEVLFSAKNSQIPTYLDKEEVEYWWDFGDMSELKQGQEVHHIYQELGDYQATLIIKTPKQEVKDEILVRVSNKAIFLIVGDQKNPLLLTTLLNQAKRMDLLVYTLMIDESSHEFIVEDLLITGMLERLEEIKRSSLILGWTDTGVEVNALLRFGKQLESEAIFKDKSIVIAFDNLNLISRRVQPVYDLLKPANAFVVSPSMIEEVLSGESKDNLIQTIQSKGSGFVFLGIHSRRNFGKITFYNFLSHFINSLINRGVSINAILLILLLPIAATIVAFARQIVGIKAFGVYIPTILALTFVAIGIGAGLVVLFVVLLIGTLIRILLKHLRLLYLPRMAILITFLSLFILLLFFASARINNLSLLSVSVFPILILVILAEEFVKVQIQEGPRNAWFLTLETVILSIITFYLINSPLLRNVLLSYPEVILLCFIVNFVLGKWTGLRIWEYYRFKEVIKAINLIDKQKK